MKKVLGHEVKFFLDTQTVLAFAVDTGTVLSQVFRLVEPLPDDVYDLVGRMLARRREDRPQDLREVRAVLEGLTGMTLTEVAVDGCSVPTWAIPLTNLAQAFARFATGHGLPPTRAKAAARMTPVLASLGLGTPRPGR